MLICIGKKDRPMTKLETDLLDLLKEDCRISLEKLSVMTGASLDEVAATIEDMEKRRIILRYAPTINWDLTDRERVEAIGEVVHSATVLGYHFLYVGRHLGHLLSYLGVKMKPIAHPTQKQ